jgi:hypothetical protein
MKTKYILKSTESFHSINHSPMNRSRSKQTYSFSKSSRFDLAKPEYDIIVSLKMSKKYV